MHVCFNQKLIVLASAALQPNGVPRAFPYREKPWERGCSPAYKDTRVMLLLEP